MQSVPITTDVSLNLNQGDVYNVCQWLATAAEKYLVSSKYRPIRMLVSVSFINCQKMAVQDGRYSALDEKDNTE